MNSAALQKVKLDDELSRLLRYCQKLMRGKALPVWQDFSPAALPWLMGHMFAVDVVDGGADYRYRSYGVLMPEIFGYDLRDKLVSEAPDADFRAATQASYGEVVREKRPVAYKVELSWPDGGRYTAEYLLVPFGDADGNVSVILGGVRPALEREERAALRGNGLAAFTELSRQIL